MCLVWLYIYAQKLSLWSCFCKLTRSIVSHFLWRIKAFLCQAGASSLWASCCGLMNEVMGTGAVRGQQPGFGAGAGPFRFAPSAGYSTYPPASSGTSGLVCKACGQAFSVFRRKVGTRGCVWQEKRDYWIALVDFWLVSFQGMLFWRNSWWDENDDILFFFRESSDLIMLLFAHR